MRDRNQERVNRNAQRAMCTVSHVADYYRRYPGEDVTFYTRVRIGETLPGFTLRIALPEGLAPGATSAPGDTVPQVGLGTGTRYLVWNVESTPGKDTYEYQVVARVEPTFKDIVLQSRATVSSKTPDGKEFSVGETTAIAVSAKGDYLKYLPALYQRDELMGRFLMLFEGFWKPIQRQIEHLPLYFDPKMTPPDLLPWLASWLGLVLEDHWSEEQRRRLIRSAVSLYRKRGTRQGLQEYLEIFGEKVQIIEHRANNFCLGSGSRLGPGIALGTNNVPHTFMVILHPAPISSSADDKEKARRALERRQMVRAIIEAEKPAHTGYTLRIETDQPASQREG